MTLLAFGVVYVPQLAMCLYTLGWVACSHCKAVVWQLAPLAPGLLAYELTRKLVDLPHFSGAAAMTAAMMLTVLMLAGIAAGFRHAGRGRIPLALLLTLGSSWLAFALLAVTRA